MRMILVSCLLLLLVALVGGQYQGYESQPGADQYEEPQYQQAQPQHYQQPKTQSYNDPQQNLPKPVILMHKQALGTDGAFNYAFTADNGLKQGESINPDGSRVGQYSYVDPTGNTIKVRYTAGKDGFRVLEGDHLPQSPPAAAAPAPAPQYSPQPAQYRPQPAQYSPQPAQYSPQPAPVQYSAPRPAAYNPPPPAYQPVESPRNYGGYEAASASPYQQSGANTLALFGGQRQQGGSPGGSLYNVNEDYARPSPVYRSTAPATFPSAPQQQHQPQQRAQQHQQEERQVPHSFGSGYSFEFGG